MKSRGFRPLDQFRRQTWYHSIASIIFKPAKANIKWNRMLLSVRWKAEDHGEWTVKCNEFWTWAFFSSKNLPDRSLSCTWILNPGNSKFESYNFIDDPIHELFPSIDQGDGKWEGNLTSASKSNSSPSHHCPLQISISSNRTILWECTFQSFCIHSPLFRRLNSFLSLERKLLEKTQSVNI